MTLQINDLIFWPIPCSIRSPHFDYPRWINGYPRDHIQDRFPDFPSFGLNTSDDFCVLVTIQLFLRQPVFCQPAKGLLEVSNNARVFILVLVVGPQIFVDLAGVRTWSN